MEMDQSIEEPLNTDVPDKVIIRYLLKEIKNLKVELGKEHAYSLELEDSLKNEQAKSSQIRLLSNDVKKEIKKEQRYQDMSTQIKSLEKSNKTLKESRDNLCFQVNRYREILLKNNLL